MPHALQTRLSRRTLLAGTAAVALPWLQAGSANAQESQIVLGQSTDLTGPLGELGSAMHQGAQAAFAAVNARGGTRGAASCSTRWTTSTMCKKAWPTSSN